MANYYCSARSNYFKVKDAEAFKKWAKSIPDIGVWEKEDEVEENPPWFAIFSENCDGGGWPSYKYAEEKDEDGEVISEDCVDLDLLEELSQHLAEGQVAILMEAGAEKLRYVCGFAQAVNWKGEVIQVSLDQIYERVSLAWDVTPTLAEY